MNTDKLMCIGAVVCLIVWVIGYYGPSGGDR